MMYGALLRPISGCTLPEDITSWELLAAGRNAPLPGRPDLPTAYSCYPYGVVRLDRVLTEDECERFALVPVTGDAYQ